MQRSKAIFSWSVTGLLTLMIVGAIAALTLKSAPNSTIGVTQTTISSGVAGAAPAPAPQASSSNSNARTVSASDTATTTTVKASSGSLTTIPAGAVIVPAPTGHESGEGNEGNEHPVTATTVKSGTTSTVKSGTTSGGHEGSGERD
ncbi:MAG: hypothetical protein WCG18_06175 [Acidimicrobiaceae bacterium]|jgi:hypothetical protein